MKKYKTCCVYAPAESVNAMVESAKEINFEELLQEVDQQELDNTFPMYEGIELTLKSDWHTRYYQSTYEGKPCVFVVHSGIEYVFTDG